MSYRALVSIQEGDFMRDYRMTLDEDFKDGERIAHELAEARDFGLAEELAGAHPLLGAIDFPSSVERAEWIKTWADQVWGVTFRKDGRFIEVQIDGLDAILTPFFMRRQVFYTS